MTPINSPLFGRGVIRIYSMPGRDFRAAIFTDNEHPHLAVYSDGSIELGHPPGPLETTVKDMPALLAEIERLHKEIAR